MSCLVFSLLCAPKSVGLLSSSPAMAMDLEFDDGMQELPSAAWPTTDQVH